MDRAYSYINERIDRNAGPVMRWIWETLQWSAQDTLGIAGILFLVTIFVLLIFSFFWSPLEDKPKLPVLLEDIAINEADKIGQLVEIHFGHEYITQYDEILLEIKEITIKTDVSNLDISFVQEGHTTPDRDSANYNYSVQQHRSHSEAPITLANLAQANQQYPIFGEFRCSHMSDKRKVNRFSFLINYRPTYHSSYVTNHGAGVYTGPNRSISSIILRILPGSFQTAHLRLWGLQPKEGANGPR